MSLVEGESRHAHTKRLDCPEGSLLRGKEVWERYGVGSKTSEAYR